MAAPVAAPARRRVLLVDAPGFFRELVHESLVEAGFAVDVVPDEPAALSALRQRSYQLLVCEVRRPGGDAEGFVERVRARHSSAELPILATSNVGIGSAELRQLETVGVDGFVSKLAPREHLAWRARCLTFPLGPDERGQLRIAACLPVRFRSGGLTAHARTLNLSRGGMFIRTNTPPAAGARVWVTFGLPDSTRTFRLAGTVLHRQADDEDAVIAAGFGVRFDDVPAEDSALLEDFVAAEARR